MPSVHNDEPVLLDELRRMDLVCDVAQEIAQRQPPYVLGIHGEWGAGKTSFLCQLHQCLTGDCPQLSIDDATKAAFEREIQAHWPDYDLGKLDHVTVVWFEAWRYQHDSTPIVALLHEIREQLSWRLKLTGRLAKLGEVAIRGALLSIEDLTAKIGFQASKVIEAGEKWERDNLAVALPSHMVRQHLEDALAKLLGKPAKRAKTDGPSRRLVVLIDDLDRCEPRSAYRLLEGIKIYLNLPSCLFVLGMNTRVIESAIASQLPERHSLADRALLAREYLEKLCQNVHLLPREYEPADMLKRQLAAGVQELRRKAGAAPPGGPGAARLMARYMELGADSDRVADLARDFACLPVNPRKIKAFANVAERFIEHVHDHPDAAFDSNADRRAKMTLAMACLYHFHPELYRIIERDITFFDRILKWANNDLTVRHELLDGIKLPIDVPGRGADQAPTTGTSTTAEPTYPDPAEGNVLRIQRLLVIVNQTPVTVTEAGRYVLRYGTHEQAPNQQAG